MANTSFPLSRNNDLVVQKMEGEVLIYDLRINKAYCLNETASLVWEACDGNRTVSEIGDYVGSKVNAPANDDLVWLALDQLKKDDLLANGEQLVTRFTGVSRREAIRKVGLATMIALPVISSLVAPAAVHAQSCLAEGSSCIPDPDPALQCCPGLTCSAGICENFGGV